MAAALVWLRRDLRLVDHQAISQATQQHSAVYLVVCLDDVYFTGHESSPRRSAFYLQSLQDLQQALAHYHASLLFVAGDPTERLPALAQELAISAVFWTKDYTPQAIKRDAAVQRALEQKAILCHPCHDQLFLEPSLIHKKDGTAFQVFTPFARQWRQIAQQQSLKEHVVISRHLALATHTLHTQSLAIFRRYMTKYGTASLQDCPFPPRRQIAIKRLETFLDQGIDSYAKHRDLLSADGTSQLSAYLRFGILGIREVLRAIAGLSRSQTLLDLPVGPATYVTELIWREFYHHVLFHFPHSLTHSYKPQYDNLAWQHHPAWFSAWKEGKTGYPLVDAAMRQLTTTGWMHNRGRMVVASFLCKDLLIDWKLGARFFAQHLIDHDPAANIGGWQWAAGTGTDAQPYFRIFNPTNQQQKFDPDATYIGRWVPEYGTDSYPAPIVDHAKQREQALRLYRR